MGAKTKNSKEKRLSCIKEGDKLNKSEYHFLELLLLFCKKTDRSCKPESHRSFHINKPEDEAEKSFCLLFKVDRQTENDPLVEEGRRPDYLALYVSPGKCLATIIEMKGRGMESGVGQVVAFHRILKDVFVRHLPGGWKIKIQAVILGAPNATIPQPRLDREKKAGLHIFPLSYPQRFELFDYVSVDMTKNPRSYTTYKHKEFKKAETQFTDLETIFKDFALPLPAENAYCQENRKPLIEREGIYLNYRCGSHDDVLIFHTTPKKLIVVSPDSCREMIKTELESIGLPKWEFK